MFSTCIFELRPTSARKLRRIGDTPAPSAGVPAGIAASSSSRRYLKSRFQSFLWSDLLKESRYDFK